MLHSSLVIRPDCSSSARIARAENGEKGWGGQSRISTHKRGNSYYTQVDTHLRSETLVNYSKAEQTGGEDGDMLHTSHTNKVETDGVVCLSNTSVLAWRNQLGEQVIKVLKI